jgi:arsenate reductase
MESITLFHNPRCSKSRAAKEMLESRGVAFDVVEYLDAPPNRSTLEVLISKSGVSPEAFVRSGDSAFKEAGLEAPSGAGETAALLAEHPAVLQRPILVIGNKVVIGRPTERVAQALDEAGL